MSGSYLGGEQGMLSLLPSQAQVMSRWKVTLSMGRRVINAPCALCAEQAAQCAVYQ